MNFLLKILVADINFSAAGPDLSTPRDALIHYRDILCAGIDKDTADQTAKDFDDLLKKLDSGKFSSDQVQLLHLAAKHACELVRGIVGFITINREDDVAMRADHLRDVVFIGLQVIQKAAVGENVKKHLELYQRKRITD
jgi:hypothetical protein